jgi:hypothetical protein
MPSKRIKRTRGYNPKIVSLQIENLHQLYDVLALQSGNIRKSSPNPKVRIRSIEDAHEAWELNRDLFMRMCTCYEVKTCCEDHALKNNPGTRPWAFWIFDQGREEVPFDESGELDRLGMLSETEKKLIKPRPADPDINFNAGRTRREEVL